MTPLSGLLLQVLFAFMVGLHNLYWYYGSQTYKQEGTDKLVHTSEAFQGFVNLHSLRALFSRLFLQSCSVIPFSSYSRWLAAITYEISLQSSVVRVTSDVQCPRAK